MRGLARQTWFVVAIAGIALAVGVAISAAAVFGTSAETRSGAGPARAKLTAFGSCDPLREYLQRHRRAVRSGPLVPIPVAEDTLAATPGAGGETIETPGGATNVQEAGVDEPDIVKAAGSTILALAGDRLHAVSTVDGVPSVLDSIEMPGRAPAPSPMSASCSSPASGRW